MKSWKTTLGGIVGIVMLAVKYYWPQHSAILTEFIALATSLGLIAARDNNVSSEEAGAK